METLQKKLNYSDAIIDAIQLRLRRIAFESKLFLLLTISTD